MTRRLPRWPWVVGLLLALLTIGSLEWRRARVFGRERSAARDGDRSRAVTRGVRWTPRAMPRFTHRPARGLISVSGQVLEADSGAPVPGVQVILSDGDTEADAMSDGEGRYTIDVSAGRYRLFTRGDDVLSVAPAQRPRLLARPRHHEVAFPRRLLAPELVVDRTVTGADLEVVRAAVVRGRVLDRKGNPIAGAIVKAHLHEAGGQPVVGTDVAETDAAGAYRLVLAARQHQLEAFHDRFGATLRRPILVLAASQTYDVDLTMTLGCMIIGRVVSAGGEPGIGGIERAGGLDNPLAYSRAGSFDADGRFVWSSDEETEVVLRAFPLKSPPSEPKTFACRDGARFDVVFEVPDVDGDLMGTVVTADGAPAALAPIEVHGLRPGTNDQQERADVHGAWESFTLPPGEYAVVSQVAGHGLAVTSVTAPARDVELRLSGTGSLVGRTRGMASGAFVLEVDCDTGYMKFATATETFLVTVDGGRFQLDDLPACKLSIVARRGRWRTPTIQAEVHRGAVTELDLDLTTVVAKAVHGVARDRLGRPVAGVAVAVLNAPIAPTTTDDAGRFVIRAPISASIAVAGVPNPLEIPDDDQPIWDVDVTVDQVP